MANLYEAQLLENIELFRQLADITNTNRHLPLADTGLHVRLKPALFSMVRDASKEDFATKKSKPLSLCQVIFLAPHTFGEA